MLFTKKTQKNNPGISFFAYLPNWLIPVFILFISAFLWHGSLIVSAAPDRELSYHGKLTDTDNVAVDDGDYEFTLSIYDASTGGTCLWTARGTCGTPTSKTIAIEKGVFSTMLGESGDNSLDIDFTSNYYLDVKVGTNASMTPRRKITPTGFALNAQRLNGLEAAETGVNAHIVATNGDGDLTINGNLSVEGGLNDSGGLAGTNGQVLTSTVNGVSWVDANTLGTKLFTGLTDVPQTYTAGSIMFMTGNALAVDNANFYWQNSSKRLGLGRNDPVGVISTSLYSTASLGFIESPYFNSGEYQNYLLQTEVFSAANWIKTNLSGTVISNSAIDPRGTASAENIPAGTNSTGSVSQVIADATTGNWTFSVYLKSQSGTQNVKLRIDSNGETGTEQSVNVTTDWQRYAVTQNFSAAHTTKTVYIVNGTAAIAAFAAQLEPTNYARPYSGARTTTALTTLTRSTQLFSNVNITGALSGLTSLSMAGSLSGVTTFSNSSTNTLTRSGLASTSSDGFIATNTTAATVGVPVQISPRLRLSGAVWDLGSAASRTTNWKIENLSSSGNPGTSRMLFGYDYNGGGYSELFSFASNGNLGIGQAAPSARLHIAAGTSAASSAPIKLTTGTNMSTPERGAIEFDGSSLYFTPNTVREEIAFASELHSPVSLDGMFDYLTISGQNITQNYIDLSTDITNNLPILHGGTGLSDFGTAHQILGMNAAGTGYEYKSISGTANQISVAQSANSITFALPQDIASTSTPVFANLTLDGSLAITESGVSPEYHTYFTGSDQLSDITYQLPEGYPLFNDQVLTAQTDGTLQWQDIADFGGVHGSATTGQVAYWSDATTIAGENYLHASRGGTGIDGSSASAGQLLIGNGGGYSLAQITSGSGIDIINAAGSITLSTILGEDIDIATETNLTGDTEIVLSGNTLSIASSIARDNELHAAVVLDGTPNYLTISGQNITQDFIDLSTDITGTLTVSHGGTGLMSYGTANQIMGMNAAGSGLEYKTISGTADQINVANTANLLTLSLPQSIATTSTPTFGGMTLSNLTSGSIAFAGAGGLLSQDNSNFYWDNGSKRLGIGTNAPATALEVRNTTSPQLRLSYSSGEYAHLGVDSNGGMLIGTPNGAGNSMLFSSGMNSGGGISESFGIQTSQTLASLDEILQIKNNSTNLLTILGNGNVGIGNVSPIDKVDISGFAIADDFLSRQHRYRQDFSRDKANLTGDSIAWGDDESVVFNEIGTMTISIVNDMVNGISRCITDAAGDGCSLSTSAETTTDRQMIYNAANRPVGLFQVRPSVIGANNDVYVGFNNVIDGAWVAEPTEGAFFTNDNGAGTTPWVGVYKAGAGRATVTCTGQNISTTQFALMRIDVLSPTQAEFFIDADISNGINMVSCGTATLTTASSTSNLKWSTTYKVNTGGTGAANFDVDFVQISQDDPISGAGIANSVASTTPIDHDVQADLAEAYPADDPEKMLPGSVLSIDKKSSVKVKLSEKKYDENVIGVVPTSAHTVMGEERDGTETVRVALVGRVPVRVNKEGGEIKVGDYLTSSGTNGVAMKSTRSGMVIGKALEPFNGDGEGLVSMFISLEYIDPRGPLKNEYVMNTQYSDQQLGDHGAVLQDGYLAKIMQLQPMSLNYNKLADYEGDVQDKMIGGFIAQDLQGIFPDMVEHTMIDNVDYLETNISTLPVFLTKAMQEQQLLIQKNTNDITQKANVTSLEVLEDLVYALPKKVYGDTEISLKEINDEILLVKDDANVQADIIEELQKDMVTQDQYNTLEDLVDAYHDTIIAVNENFLFTTNEDDGSIITISGIMMADMIDVVHIKTETFSMEDDVTVERDDEKINASSVGTATIIAGDAEVGVKTDIVNADDRIFVTVRDAEEVVAVQVRDVEEGKFIIEMDHVVENDVKVDWFIIDSEHVD